MRTATIVMCRAGLAWGLPSDVRGQRSDKEIDDCDPE